MNRESKQPQGCPTLWDNYPEIQYSSMLSLETWALANPWDATYLRMLSGLLTPARADIRLHICFQHPLPSVWNDPAVQ